MEFELDGQIIKISSEDRLYFPESGITKGDYAQYCHDIAPVMVPHICDRPITMLRYPKGITKGHFYQKRFPKNFPDWINHCDVVNTYGEAVQFVVPQNAAALVFLAQQACITVHAFTAPAKNIRYPDRLILDLDPNGSASFDDVLFGAKALRDLLGEKGLPTFTMTTGSRGLHVVTPIETSHHIDRVRAYARQLAEELVDKYPDRFTIEQKKKDRGDRIFLDYMRNSFAATGVAPYGVRAKEGAPVATPVEWAELDDADFAPQKWTLRNVRERVAERGDPWADIRASTTALPISDEEE